jgi:hypothetical protein
MASPAAEGAGKEEDKPTTTTTTTTAKKGGGVLGRMWRGLFGGREDYEKRLQYLSKEEASVHARMRRRTQFSRRTVRNIIVLSVLAEVPAAHQIPSPSPFPSRNYYCADAPEIICCSVCRYMPVPGFRAHSIC